LKKTGAQKGGKRAAKNYTKKAQKVYTEAFLAIAIA
jgi:hypothetical protein